MTRHSIQPNSFTLTFWMACLDATQEGLAFVKQRRAKSSENIFDLVNAFAKELLYLELFLFVWFGS